MTLVLVLAGSGAVLCFKSSRWLWRVSSFVWGKFVGLAGPSQYPAFWYAVYRSVPLGIVMLMIGIWLSAGGSAAEARNLNIQKISDLLYLSQLCLTLGAVSITGGLLYWLAHYTETKASTAHPRAPARAKPKPSQSRNTKAKKKEPKRPARRSTARKSS